MAFTSYPLKPTNQVRIPLAQRWQPVDSTNTLVLNNPGTVPFHLSDWPLPVLKVNTYRPTHNRPKVSQPVIFVAPTAGSSQEQPNPQRPRYPIDARNWANALSLNLYQQDSVYGGAAQPASFDWPNPIRKKLPTDIWGYAQAITILLPPGAGPVTTIFNNPWPRTPVAQYIPMATVDRLPPTVSNDQFFGDPGMGPVYHWPVPKGYRYPTSLWTWAQDLVSSKLSTLVPIPLKDYDRPNPIRLKYPYGLYNYNESIDLMLVGQDAMTADIGRGPQYEYPNPRGYAYPTALRSFTTGFNPAITFTPFKQTEHPNPILLKYPSELRTFLQAFENYMQSGAVPFHLTDQPNPLPYIYSKEFRTWMQMFDLELIGQDQFFGANGESKTYDWTNPLIKYAVRSIYDPNFGYITNLVPQPPPMGTVLFRKTLSLLGTGVGARKRRKDS